MNFVSRIKSWIVSLFKPSVIFRCGYCISSVRKRVDVKCFVDLNNQPAGYPRGWRYCGRVRIPGTYWYANACYVCSFNCWVKRMNHLVSLGSAKVVSRLGVDCCYEIQSDQFGSLREY